MSTFYNNVSSRANRVTKNTFYISSYILHRSEELLSIEEFLNNVEIYSYKHGDYLLTCRFNKDHTIDRIIAYVGKNKVFDYGCWNTKYLDFKEETYLHCVLQILAEHGLFIDTDEIPDMQMIDL